MAEQLSVTLATIGRFHSFEVAAELERRGVLACIYSGYARRFIGKVGVRDRHIRTFPWVQTPLQGLSRLGLTPGRLGRELAWWSTGSLDRHVARTLPPCHVFSALSGAGLAAGRVAQARGGAYVCERASSHIVWQDRILRAAFDDLGLPYPGIDPRFIEKEQAEYATADAILVPSGFVRRSFVESGVAGAKLRTIPLGVNLATYRRVCPRDAEFRILFVGQLSVRKGLHHLLRAVARADLPGATLVLAGGAQGETDALLERFPVARIERTGVLSRPEVARQMSRASAFVLPSVEEGFGLVLAEALACGCPVIASRNSGAADLFSDGDEGFIVPAGDEDAIADRLTRLHDDRALLDAMSARAVARVTRLGGWDSYGAAVADFYLGLARARGHDVTIAAPAP